MSRKQLPYNQIPQRDARRPATSRERGAALIVSLMLLMVMTLVGVTSIQGTILQERMAGNMRDRSLGFMATEAALDACERFLTQAVLPPFDGTNGLYQEAPVGDPPRWAQVDWTSAADTRVLGAALEDVSRDPRCIIEELRNLPLAGGSPRPGAPQQHTTMYRITAQGWGGSNEAVVMLQTTYQR